MTTQKQLAAVQKKLEAIKLKVDNLLTAVEKSETKPTKASKAKAVKATPAKKAPKAPAKKKAVKVTATDEVLKIINRSKKGVNTVTLMKKTGFDQKKVRNILNRTFKQGKITRLEKGIYVGVK
jgi:DNA replicative helicase MCM subunit Mcm2 (Cdc46/Mcm family)